MTWRARPLVCSSFASNKLTVQPIACLGKDAARETMQSSQRRVADTTAQAAAPWLPGEAVDEIVRRRSRRAAPSLST